ncbi:MAG: hemin uptake protein HemP [Pseudomonadota bacterium]
MALKSRHKSDGLVEPLARATEGEGPKQARPLRTDRVVDTNTLFDGAKEIGIDHDGVLYRLKITRHGKLILNK